MRLQPRITLLRYFKAYSRSLSALAGLGIVPAVFSRAIPDWGSYCFPPLGMVDPTARIGTVMLAFLVVCCGYFMINSSKTGYYIAVSASVLAICFVAYLAASVAYIRRIDIPSSGKAVLVSVGAQRSDYANKEFVDKSDWDMLRERGPIEEEIYNLWTPRSITWARLSLFLPYLGMVLAWTFCFSAFMARELSTDRHPPQTDA